MYVKERQIFGINTISLNYLTITILLTHKLRNKLQAFILFQHYLTIDLLNLLSYIYLLLFIDYCIICIITVYVFSDHYEGKLYSLSRMFKSKHCGSLFGSAELQQPYNCDPIICKPTLALPTTFIDHPAESAISTNEVVCLAVYKRAVMC